MEGVETMIVAGTGHRPDKLGGYGIAVPARLVKLAEVAIQKFQPSKVISGIALGWDQALAQAAINMTVPFVAAIPFQGQHLIWPKESQKRYEHLLMLALEVVDVSDGKKSHNKAEVSVMMQARNRWMVDNCDVVWALWDGSKGGTANCIRYAREVDRKVLNFWASWARIK